jgi:histidinol-phosphate aminotransferase
VTSPMTASIPAATARRECYSAIRLYSPDRRPAAVDLSDNTNRWGMPPAALRALRSASGDACARYPEIYAGALKEALADYAGVDPSMIVTGCGSDDVLDSAIRAFAEPGDRVAIPDPSFAMIPLFARMNGLEPLLAPLTDSYDVNVQDMLACEPRVAYVCSPNNPTGTLISRASIESLAARVSGVVIVDEAYAEFADTDVLDLARAKGSNVLVVRTMSKAFGLAGLRVGYAVGDPALVAEVEKSRGPYKVSAVAGAAAIAALREGLPWVREHMALAIAARERLARELARRGIPALSSSANFVLAPVTNAEAIALRMRELGVAARPFTDLRAVSEEFRATQGAALRISVGPWPEIELALTALDTAKGEAQCA